MRSINSEGYDGPTDRFGDRRRSFAMDIRVSMRQLDADRWVATSDGDLAVQANGATRQECLERFRRVLRDRVENQPEPLTLIVEVVPMLAGVAEAARVMGWDKRRVITYIDRGRFPEPVQALASGRVWVRSDVERFAEEWRARQLSRRRGRPPEESPPGEGPG